MKFYGNGVVWDPENDKRLFKFINGEFETDDERIIRIMGAGSLEDKTFNELRAKAKGKVKGYGKMNKQELIDALKEVSK